MANRADVVSMDSFPNPDRVTIHPAKLTGYLLSLTNLQGMGKAKWFRRIGYDVSNADLLAKALCRFPLDCSLVEMIPSPPYGTKYVVDGELNGPAGRGIVRTVWQLDAGETNPRLITAYPTGETEKDDD